MFRDSLKFALYADANDHLYQWESSGDYNPSAGLERIEAAVLAINSPTTNATRLRPESWNAR